MFCSKGWARPRDAPPPRCGLQVVATEQRPLGMPRSSIPEPQIATAWKLPHRPMGHRRAGLCLVFYAEFSVVPCVPVAPGGIRPATAEAGPRHAPRHYSLCGILLRELDAEAGHACLPGRPVQCRLVASPEAQPVPGSPSACCREPAAASAGPPTPPSGVRFVYIRARHSRRPRSCSECLCRPAPPASLHAHALKMGLHLAETQASKLFFGPPPPAGNATGRHQGALFTLEPGTGRRWVGEPSWFPHKLIELALHCSKWQNNAVLAAFRWKLNLFLNRPSERCKTNPESLATNAALVTWLVWARESRRKTASPTERFHLPPHPPETGKSGRNPTPRPGTLTTAGQQGPRTADEGPERGPHAPRLWVRSPVAGGGGRWGIRRRGRMQCVQLRKYRCGPFPLQPPLRLS